LHLIELTHLDQTLLEQDVYNLRLAPHFTAVDLDNKLPFMPPTDKSTDATTAFGLPTHFFLMASAVLGSVG